MDVLIYSIGSSIFVGLVSLVGILVLLSKIYKNKNILTVLISFAAGALLGDVFLHLLDAHIESFGYNPASILFILIGVGVMLITEAYFHCSHDSEEALEEHKDHTLAKINILGDGLHNFLDGVSLASSFIVSPSAGVATMLAVTLHEIPQELADVAVMSYSGWSRRKILGINLLTGFSAVLGVVGALTLNQLVDNAEKYLIPLAVGQFIYIALADLVPEIHKKTGVAKYFVEIFMFILGLLVMYALTWIE